MSKNNVFFVSNSIQLFAACIIAKRYEESINILITINMLHNPECHGFALEKLIRKNSKFFSQIYNIDNIIFPNVLRYWNPSIDYLSTIEKLLLKIFNNSPVTDIFIPFINTHPYRNLCLLFPQAAIHLLPDGLIDFSPAKYQSTNIFIKRCITSYSFDYDEKIQTNLFKQDHINYEQIRFSTVKNTCFKDTEKIKIGENIVYLGASFSSVNPKILSQKEEINLYIKDISNLISKYPDKQIFFKIHPQSSYMIPAILNQKFSHLNIKFLGADSPIELDHLKYGFKYSSGQISTGIITLNKIFNIAYIPLNKTIKIPCTNSNFISSMAFDYIINKNFTKNEFLKKIFTSAYVDHFDKISSLKVEPNNFLTRKQQKSIAFSLLCNKSYEKCIKFINDSRRNGKSKIYFCRIIRLICYKKTDTEKYMREVYKLTHKFNGRILMYLYTAYIKSITFLKDTRHKI